MHFSMVVVVVKVSFMVEISVVEVLMCVVVVLINDSLLMDVVLMEDTLRNSSRLMDVMLMEVALLDVSLLFAILSLEVKLLNVSLLMDVMLIEVTLPNDSLVDGGNAPLDRPPRSNTNASFLAWTNAAEFDEPRMTMATMTADECKIDFRSFISLYVSCGDVREVR